jgi:hypothetical protein
LAIDVRKAVVDGSRLVEALKVTGWKRCPPPLLGLEPAYLVVQNHGYTCRKALDCLPMVGLVEFDRNALGTLKGHRGDDAVARAAWDLERRDRSHPLGASTGNLSRFIALLEEAIHGLSLLV